MKAVVFLSLLVLIHGATEKRVKIIGVKGTVIESVVSNEQVTVHEENKDEDILTVNKKYPGSHLVEGDMIPVPGSRNAITDTNSYWPTSVPIQFSPTLNLLAISSIEDARQEYELRTCLSFPDKTTSDRNYLYFDAQSGCWSYVGEIGGRQTVSIGSGCEQMSTVVHEIMHAIGIYHEQSRTDRDGYITIETENIDADKVYNFDKYGYDFVDDRRVAYDYNSVMHYGETAFSNNGEKTILTRDPKFQHLIGQRRTFSEGDVTMINRMYKCADPLRVSYTCNFEDDLICGYIQDKIADDIDWLRYEIGETDGSQISSSLPQTDGTDGEHGKGSYMVLDTSNVAEQTGYLTSMRHKSNHSEQCLEFNFYMDLEAGSSASLSVQLAEISALNGDIMSTTQVAYFSADYGAQWITDRRTVQASSVYKLILQGNGGGMANDVIAIDDISILDRPCDTAYFTITQFSELIATSQKGDWLYGPLLFTDEGYAFRILMYPHGSTSAADGYLSIYFALAQGPNDDTLQWPFYDYVVRMMVVDQGADALTRMNEYKNYITGSNGGSSWDQPTSEVNSAWGYTNFMRLDNIMNTRNFLKHDSVKISINVRNMNTYTREHADAFAERHPSMPILKTSDHHHHHHDDEDDKRDINININAGPQPSDDVEEEKRVSTALVGGVAFACAFAVFMLMSIVVVCINQSHKQAMTAVTIASLGAKIGAEEGRYSNAGYHQEKV